jgi:regulator of sigma E protease
MPQIAQLALTYTLPFLAVLTLVVSIHEFGHFLAARACGVAVDVFSIGFGRPIVSWRDRHGTEWRISWLPLGGYVRYALDDNAASIPDTDDLDVLRNKVLAREGAEGLKRYYVFKPLWQRALCASAGPVANFVLAIVLFAALAMLVGEVIVAPKIGKVEAGSPAAAAGFQPGDVVISANGAHIVDFDQLSEVVKLRTGEPIRFVLERAGRRIGVVATPVRHRFEAGPSSRPISAGYLGVYASLKPEDARLVRFGPISALREGVRKTGDILGSTVDYVSRIVQGRESGDQFSGPLGIAGLTGDVASEATKQATNWQTGAAQLAYGLVNLAAFISVALGFANLLPIPVLDGGHLLFYAYEAIARRPLAASLQAAGYRVGFALLIGLMLFVTWNDLQRYQVFNMIGGLFS